MRNAGSNPVSGLMKIEDVKATKGDPHDRLTSIADEMLQHVPDGVRAVVLLTEPSEDGTNIGGAGLRGYEMRSDTLPGDLLHHGKALEEAGY